MEIEKPSLKELLLQRQTLQQQVSAARQREAEAVLADIVRKMHEYESKRLAWAIRPFACA